MAQQCECGGNGYHYGSCPVYNAEFRAPAIAVADLLDQLTEDLRFVAASYRQPAPSVGFAHRRAAELDRIAKAVAAAASAPVQL